MHPPEHNPEQQMQRRLPKPPTSPMNAAIPSSSVLLVLPIYQSLSLSLSLSQQPKIALYSRNSKCKSFGAQEESIYRTPRKQKDKKALCFSEIFFKEQMKSKPCSSGSYIEQAASCRAPEDSKQMIAFCKLQSCPSLHYAIGSTLPVVTAVTTNQQTSWKRSKAY
jgi:hypothetical protein